MSREIIENVIKKDGEVSAFNQYIRTIKVLTSKSFKLTDKLVAKLVKDAKPRKPELVLRFLGYTVYCRIEEMNG